MGAESSNDNEVVAVLMTTRRIRLPALLRVGQANEALPPAKGTMKP